MVQEIVKNLDFLLKATDYLSQSHDNFTLNLVLGQEIRICKTFSCQATAPVIPLKIDNEKAISTLDHSTQHSQEETIPSSNVTPIAQSLPQREHAEKQYQDQLVKSDNTLHMIAEKVYNISDNIIIVRHKVYT